MSAVDDVIAKLQADGIATLDTDMFPGLMRDDAGTPDWCIFVERTAGFEPEPFFGGKGAPDYRQFFVQIYLRTGVNTADGGHDTALAIFDALHKQEPAGYVSWLCGEPINIGLDSGRRLQWSINLTVATCD